MLDTSKNLNVSLFAEIVEAVRSSVPCNKSYCQSRAINSPVRCKNVWGGQAELNTLSEALSSLNSTPSS